MWRQVINQLRLCEEGAGINGMRNTDLGSLASACEKISALFALFATYRYCAECI